MTFSKIRLFLSTEDGLRTVYVAWFQVAAADFYWGLARPSVDRTIGIEIDDKNVSLELPATLEGIPTAHWKSSWHASGVRHTTTDGSGALKISDAYVGGVRELSGPSLLGALLMKPPANGVQHAGAKTKKGGAAIVFRINPASWQDRFYLEMYVSPVGTHPMPQPLLSGVANDLPVHRFVVGEAEDVVLMMRAAPVRGSLSGWRPDVSICILPDRNDERLEDHPR